MNVVCLVLGHKVRFWVGEAFSLEVRPTAAIGEAHPVKQGSPEWVASRRGYLGASEMAAILGEDPYRGEYELALLKKGLAEPEPQVVHDARWWGNAVQRLAVEAYARMTAQKVRNVATTVTSRTHPHVKATIDGRVVGKRKGIEVKLTGQHWDEEPPRRVVIQCQTQMAVVRLDSVDVVKVGLRYQAPEVYTVWRDAEAGRELLDLGEAWYLRFVEGDELPPVDGSRAAHEYLSLTPPGTEERAATDLQTEWAREYLDVKDELKSLEGHKELLRNQIVDSMKRDAGTGVLVGPGVRARWHVVKAPTVTDWQAVAKSYREILMGVREVPSGMSAADALDALESLATSTGDPYDRLDVRRAGS